MNSIDILDVLVSLPTVSGTSNADLVDWVEAYLLERNAQVRRVPGPNPGTWNLWATLGPDDVPGILLSGHSDVVPVDGQKWNSAPFALTRQGDRLYGRGTADMKGFLACALTAFDRAARTDNVPLAAPLHLALSCEEEVGCVGVRTLLPELKHLPVQPYLCIIGEPTDMRCATGHKGKIAARARCYGRSAHSAMPMQGVNAIYLAADFISAIRLVQAWIEQQGVHDVAFTVPWSTLHVGTITGGTALNIVPERCEVDFELRSVPGEDTQAIIDRLYDAARRISADHGTTFPDARIEIEIVNAYPGLSTNDGEWSQFLASVTGTNSDVKLAFGTEGGLFAQALDSTTVLVCGPGSMDQGHKPDEFVEIDQMDRCDAMLDRVIARLREGPGTSA